MKQKHPGKQWGRQLFQAGQDHRFTLQRRYESRVTRHAYRQFCGNLTQLTNEVDIEDEQFYELEEIDDPEPRKRMGKFQDDYLAPLTNFLATYVNHPWDIVFSKLSQRMDRNSTCGDHVWLHLKHYIEEHPWRIEDYRNNRPQRPPYFWCEYYIDEEGILRSSMQAPKPRPKVSSKRKEEDRQKAIALLQRAIDYVYDEDFVGMIPVIEKSTYGSGYDIRFAHTRIVVCDGVPHWGLPNGYKMYRELWKPGPRLSNGYAEIYWSLCDDIREAITDRP